MAIIPLFEGDQQEDILSEKEQELTNQDIAFNNLYDSHDRLDALANFYNTHVGRATIEYIASKPEENLSPAERELFKEFKEEVDEDRKIYLTLWFSYSLLLMDPNLTYEDKIDLKRHSPHNIKLEGSLKFFLCSPSAPIVTPEALNRLVSNVLETASPAPRNSCN